MTQFSRLNLDQLNTLRKKIRSNIDFNYLKLRQLDKPEADYLFAKRSIDQLAHDLMDVDNEITQKEKPI